MTVIPKEAKVVVVGGGVIGCSIAYQLAKQGAGEVVLFERKQIACGTSWHAAGILSEMRASESMVHLARETTNMFCDLEVETEHSMNFKRTGTLFVTSVPDRHQQFKFMLSMAASFGIEAHEISIPEAKEKWPLLNDSDLVGAIWAPNDALVCPEQATLALAKGAKMHGAQIFEDTKVLEVLHKDGKACGVRTEFGELAAEYVVVCGGIWSRDFMADHGVNVPLHAMEHYYLLTEPIAGVDPMLPLLRDFDARSYVRPTMGTRWHTENGHLMLGFFERNGKPWGEEGIPEDFAFGHLEGHRDHIEQVYQLIRHRIPAVKEVGIETFFCGPESFTYDNNYFLGESQNVNNLLLATGFNSRGIQSAGGAGRYIAEWILQGSAPNRYDASDIQSSRPPAHTANRKFLYDRSKEILGLLYDISYPYLQLESARPIRTSPLHDRLKARGACFGELSGWERPNWYAPDLNNPQYHYSFGEQNWFANAALEHMAVREHVGIFDQSSFGKILVQGSGALGALDWLSPSVINTPIGKITYTQLLNNRGGVESDITIIRCAEDEFLIYTSAGSQARDMAYLKKEIRRKGFEATVTDMTSAYAVFGIMGPGSRGLLSALSTADFSNEGFPFGTSRLIDFGYARARASRITFVGELGWEISVPTEYALSAFDTLMGEADKQGAALCGYHAMNSLRLEKGYLHWGHDVSGAETPYEAGVGFCVRLKKPGDFLGKSILQQQKEQGIGKRIVSFRITEPSPPAYHYEPIIRNGEIVGHLTSGMYSPYFKTSIGIGYVKNSTGVADKDYLLDAEYKVRILNQDYPAKPSLRALYDPGMEKIKC